MTYRVFGLTAVVVLCGALFSGADLAYAENTQVQPITLGAVTAAYTQATAIQVVPTEGNLIRNPSFEVVDENGLPANWIQGTWGVNAPTFSYVTSSYDGSKAAQVSMAGYTDGDAKWVFDHVAVTPGGLYQYREYYKATVPTTIGFEYRHADGKYSYGWLGDPAAANDWTLFEGTLKVPSGTASPIVSVSVLHVLMAVGTLAIDTVSLVKEEVIPPDPSKAMVSVTFDDAWKSQYTQALPLLDKHGIKGTFYLTTQYFNTANYSGFMTRANVKDLYKRGHEIAGHTISHPDLTTLNATKLKNELVNSKRTLETLTGSKVRSIAYPYGAYNATVIAAAKAAGYETGRTVIESTNAKATPAFELRSISPSNATPLSEVTAAIDEAAAQGTWLIIAFHEIDTTGREYMNTPEYFEAVLAHIKKTGIKSTTVSDGFALR